MSGPEDKLTGLLEQFLGKELDVQEFCDQYEHAFNLEIDKTKLSAPSRRVFQELFDEVVYYSPYENDRRAYPGYRDEAEIRRAAIKARNQLT